MPTLSPVLSCSLQDVYADIAAIAGDSHVGLRITPDAAGVAYAAANHVHMDMVTDDIDEVSRESQLQMNVDVLRLCDHQHRMQNPLLLGASRVELPTTSTWT